MSSQNSNDTERPEPVASGPYATQRQAAADVAGIYDQARRANRRGALSEANLAYLRDACLRANLTTGAYDERILEWLADWEPDTCAVIVGLVTRAYAAGMTAASAAPLLDEDCQAGQHALCPGGLCQCPECRHDLRRNLWRQP